MMGAALGSGRDERIERALAELQEMILARYPAAMFEVSPGEDNPEMTHLTATVDVEDTTEVLDLVRDRVLELLVDEELPVAVIPVHTPERVAGGMRAQSATSQSVVHGAAAALAD
jgi:hypothetical protein